MLPLSLYFSTFSQLWGWVLLLEQPRGCRFWSRSQTNPNLENPQEKNKWRFTFYNPCKVICPGDSLWSIKRDRKHRLRSHAHLGNSFNHAFQCNRSLNSPSPFSSDDVLTDALRTCCPRLWRTTPSKVQCCCLMFYCKCVTSAISINKINNWEVFFPPNMSAAPHLGDSWQHVIYKMSDVTSC